MSLDTVVYDDGPHSFRVLSHRHVQRRRLGILYMTGKSLYVPLVIRVTVVVFVTVNGEKLPYGKSFECSIVGTPGPLLGVSSVTPRRYVRPLLMELDDRHGRTRESTSPLNPPTTPDYRIPTGAGRPRVLKKKEISPHLLGYHPGVALHPVVVEIFVFPFFGHTLLS